MWRELFVLALSAVAVAVAEPQGSCGIVKADQDQSRIHKDNVDSNVQLKALKRVIAHPRYNQGARFSNDAALLELSTPAEINEYVSPVCLPNVDVYGNETGLVSGWGNIREGVCCAYQLKQAQAPIHSQAVCQQPEINGMLVDSSMVCAGTLLGGISTCQGDSGGPLAYKYTSPNGKTAWQVNGLTSWAFGCARPNKPTVFGRVYAFLAWIKEVSGLEPPLL